MVVLIVKGPVINAYFDELAVYLFEREHKDSGRADYMSLEVLGCTQATASSQRPQFSRKMSKKQTNTVQTR